MEFIGNMDADLISFSMPSKAEYVGVCRLAISAIANRMGFDVEEIEDIKVCVSEACTNAIKHSNSVTFDIKVFAGKDQIDIVIEDSGKGFDIKNVGTPDLENPSEEGGLGIYIIKTLMDSVEMDSKEGEGSFIKMSKFLGD